MSGLSRIRVTTIPEPGAPITVALRYERTAGIQAAVQLTADECLQLGAHLIHIGRGDPTSGWRIRPDGRHVIDLVNTAEEPPPPSTPPDPDAIREEPEDRPSDEPISAESVAESDAIGYPCPEPTCGATFETDQGRRVHIARAHPRDRSKLRATLPPYEDVVAVGNGHRRFEHSMLAIRRTGGRYVALCKCNWQSEPAPTEIAARTALADHRRGAPLMAGA